MGWSFPLTNSIIFQDGHIAPSTRISIITMENHNFFYRYTINFYSIYVSKTFFPVFFGTFPYTGPMWPWPPRGVFVSVSIFRPGLTGERCMELNLPWVLVEATQKRWTAEKMNLGSLGSSWIILGRNWWIHLVFTLQWNTINHHPSSSLVEVYYRFNCLGIPQRFVVGILLGWHTRQSNMALGHIPLMRR